MLYALNQFIFIFPIIALGEIISLLVRNDQAVNAAFQLLPWVRPLQAVLLYLKK